MSNVPRLQMSHGFIIGMLRILNPMPLQFNRVTCPSRQTKFWPPQKATKKLSKPFCCIKEKLIKFQLVGKELHILILRHGREWSGLDIVQM